MWDENIMLRPILICTCNLELEYSCEVLKKVRENVIAEQVMKFVKGVNDSFELVRSRVLVTDPLHDMSTVFNMSINHERQQTCGNMTPQVIYVQSDIMKSAIPARSIRSVTDNQRKIPNGMINVVNFQGQGTRGKGTITRGNYITFPSATTVVMLWMDAIKSMNIHLITN